MTWAIPSGIRPKIFKKYKVFELVNIAIPYEMICVLEKTLLKHVF